MRNVLWLISTPFRVLGYILVIVGAAAGFIDLYRSVQVDRMVMTPLGEIWYTYSRETLNVTQAVVQRYLWPPLWDPGVQTFLQLPAWLAMFILAALILLVAQLIYRPR